MFLDVEDGRDLMDPEYVFGRRMREERELRGWSQAEMAQRLAEYGVELHPSAIAKMEARAASSPRAIRLNEAVAVSRVLGVDLSYLLEIDVAVTSFDRAIDEAWQQMYEFNEQAAAARREVERLRKLRDLAAFEGRQDRDTANARRLSADDKLRAAVRKGESAEALKALLRAMSREGGLKGEGDDGEHQETP